MLDSNQRLLDSNIAESKLRLLLNQNAVTLMASNFGVPLVVVILLYLLEDTNKTVLFAWFGSGILLCSIRGLHHLKLRNFKSLNRPLEHWEYEFILFAALSGCFWTASGILFLDSNNSIQSIVVVSAMLGVLSGAVPALTSHPRVFHTFVLTTWFPCALYQIVFGDFFTSVIAGVGTAYTAIIIGFCNSQRRIIDDALVLRYENIELLEELRIQKQLADDANQAKSRFLAAASHDLRQPIHAIRLFSDSLSLRIKDELNKPIMEMLSASIDTLSGLFGSLLDISKLDAQTITPESHPVNVTDVVNSLFLEFDAHAKEKGLKFRNRCQPQLYVNTDAVLLERILRNLLWNAIKYTDQGGILIGARKRQDILRIEVWDSGCGIPAEELPMIFEEFHQVHAPGDGAREGIGLGLSIVSRLSELLEYRVWLRSEFGRGSVFFLEMPLMSKSDIALLSDTFNKSKNAADDFENDTDLAEVNVLVVDDDEHILAGMTELLKGWSCNITTANSASSSMKALEEFTPDIILTDFHLQNSPPGTRVIELARKKLGYDIPGIIVTGDTSAEHLQFPRGFCSEILHKPIDTRELKSSMIRVLNA